MCYGLFLAIPPGALPPTPPGEMTVWRVDNPWLNIAVGDGWTNWAIGDGHHCSCGRVKGQRQELASGKLVTIDQEAIQYIAEAADQAGHAAFLVHWISRSFGEEEIIPQEEISISSGLFRHLPERGYPMDCLVWVGRTSRQVFVEYRPECGR